ncbi:L,D-transpeptidase family protein [Alicyclobacillus fastidiosus]|uniref:L,D-transpeptidase family protein n=1 Tax=Alicyclobacillus fastidiosus TaxID=392011 RepID=A0ABV5AHD6_9BACL|nr:L,D-transpeptidase family protein [Alicyclobacillus fastidiosus]WEH09213.1 L,D-transpeptidase family protein [Alicyclobacillus fastidiosus]
MNIPNFLRTSAALLCVGVLMAVSGCATNSAPTTTPQTISNQATGNSISTHAEHSSEGDSGTSAAKQTATKPTKPTPPPMVKLGSHTALASYLNESLSLLGYMPVQFSPAHQMTTTAAMQTLSQTKAPLPGGYAWKDKGTAGQLSALWSPLTDNVITEGALMRFQDDHHLAVDGVAGPEVWQALNEALKTQQTTQAPYLFITVTEHPTEVLKVWKNGTVALETPANTGISQSPTALGTWPIYLRYQSQEMKGTTPWGTTYDDPGVPYVNYFYQSEAVHGFPRASYGSPQSMGCVEIPIATAQTVFNMVSLGTLVSVRSS